MLAPSSFQLRAPPVTDLWRKPAAGSHPPVDSRNAPSLVTAVSVNDFRAAQVTVEADWTRLYDQGGLVLYLPKPSGAQDKEPWLKTGIEFYGNRANLSTVATAARATSDWSLVPLDGGTAKATVRVEREIHDGQPGPSLWVYLIGPDGQKNPVREVTWVFENSAAGGDLQVGAYAARPTKAGNEDDVEELIVHFSALSVERA
ncbi:hypothetical protein FRB99_006396 [Tulasnella sp. 403]|nr:hypothetical protein FRB99_006396 [Tulasnella sp. 403]